MRYVTIAALAIAAMVVGAIGAPPLPSAAQDAAPAAPAELCSAAEIARGESATILPLAQEAGVVTPLGSEGEVLYLTVVTLPPESCLGYRYRAGAVVLFVHQGAIDYTAHATDLEPNPEVMMGSGDSPSIEAQPVIFDAAVTVAANEWVTQDRGLWYTFRNAGDEDAVVSIASHVVPPWAGDPCAGSCRTP